jgi:hypothetical protein
LIFNSFKTSNSKSKLFQIIIHNLEVKKYVIQNNG